MVVAALAVTVALAFGDPRPYSGTTEVVVEPSATVSELPPAAIETTSTDGPDAATAPRAQDWSPGDPGPVARGRLPAHSVAPEEVARWVPPARRWTGSGFGPVAPPGRGDDRGRPSFDARPPSREATYAEVARWLQRRRNLRAAVGTFGSLAAAGGLLMLAPFAGVTAGGGESGDATGDMVVFFVGSALFIFGGAGTVLTAPWLAHHVRWDRPTGLVRDAPPHAAYRARHRVRQLKIALVVEAGAVLLGGIATTAGYAAASTCPDQDLGCANTRAFAGAGPGLTMIGLGTLAMVSTGVLLGLQRRHGHPRGSGPWLTGLGPFGASLRF